MTASVRDPADQRERLRRCPYPQKVAYRLPSEASRRAKLTPGDMKTYHCPCQRIHIGSAVWDTPHPGLPAPDPGLVTRETRCLWCWRPILVGSPADRLPDGFRAFCTARHGQAWDAYMPPESGPLSWVEEAACHYCDAPFTRVRWADSDHPCRLYCQDRHRALARESRRETRRLAAQGESPH